MDAFLVLASDVAPPGIPAWLWVLLGGVIVAVTEALSKAIPLLWSAARWVQKHEPPPGDSHALHVAKLNDHILADDSHFAEVREFIEASRAEQRQFHGEVRELFAWLRERITRVETLIDPHAPLREPTGKHEALKAAK